MHSVYHFYLIYQPDFVFIRYILSSMILILTNTNNRIKFTDRSPMITSPSTAIRVFLILPYTLYTLDQCTGKPVKQALPGYTRQDKIDFHYQEVSANFLWGICDFFTYISLHIYSPSIWETHACMVSIILSQLLPLIPDAMPTARSSFLPGFRPFPSIVVVCSP